MEASGLEYKSILNKYNEMYVFCSDPKKQTSSKVENIIATLTEYKALEKRLAKLTKVPPDCTYANQRALDEKVNKPLLMFCVYIVVFFPKVPLSCQKNYCSKAMVVIKKP